MPSDLIPDSHKDLLDRTGFAHLATVGSSGYPQSTPMWYLWDDGKLKFSTTKDRAKYRNLRRNPRVAVSIQDPAQPYRYLQVRGTVAAIDDDPELKFIDVLAKKYLGVDEYPNKQPDEERVVVSVVPEGATTMG